MLIISVNLQISRKFYSLLLNVHVNELTLLLPLYFEFLSHLGLIHFFQKWLFEAFVIAHLITAKYMLSWFKYVYVLAETTPSHIICSFFSFCRRLFLVFISSMVHYCVNNKILELFNFCEPAC